MSNTDVETLLKDAHRAILEPENAGMDLRLIVRELRERAPDRLDALLGSAITWLNEDAARVLLASGANPNWRYDGGVPIPLSYASSTKPSPVIFDALRKHGGDFLALDDKGYSAAYYAAANGNMAVLSHVLELCPQLVNLPTDPRTGRGTPLDVADHFRRKDVMAFLLEKGGKPASKIKPDEKRELLNALDLARKSQDLIRAGEMEADVLRATLTPLERRDDEWRLETEVLCRATLAVGVDLPDHVRRDARALLDGLVRSAHEATREETSRLYLGRIVSVPVGLRRCDAALAHAAAAGNGISVARLLAENRANPTPTGVPPFSTGLHEAACNGHANVLIMLMRAASDKNIRDTIGATPLLHAACIGGGDLKRVKTPAALDVLLAEPDVDRNAVCANGENALHYALAGGDINPLIVRRLIEAGVDLDKKSETGRKFKTCRDVEFPAGVTPREMMARLLPSVAEFAPKPAAVRPSPVKSAGGRVRGV